MAHSIDVANHFLTLEGEAGEISNLKLQKLVYYAQGFSLALLGKPLFEDRIEAWMHGPVVPELYRCFSLHGSNPIPAPALFEPTMFSREQSRLIAEVFAVYGQYSAWKLRQLTHEEDPWRDNYQEGAFSREIPRHEMERYFRNHLVN
ncbi:Panacea domain-containing protein [Pseudomonas sichuanensis]|uniref:Panacea domain-containing protein n=1 Tax=Pseudomonas sichuanensis TaxID=2213015 RepID=UPI001FC902E1|nr:type II toxin-antitoxin system antitoxin SocA domain-containing protein [Pseudomonas sichuanensis]